MDIVLLLVAFLSAGTAAVFFAVARAVALRTVQAGDRAALRAFAMFWRAQATYLLLHAALEMAAAFGATALPATVAVRLVSGPILGLAAGSLSFYLLYIFSGWRGWGWVTALYYGGAGIAYSVLIWAAGPVGVVVGPYEVGLLYERSRDGPAWTLLLSSFAAPLVLGSLAYLLLLRKVRLAAQRYRIILVSTSLLVWVTSGLAGQLEGNAFVRFATIVLLGTFAALGVLAAYYPPPRVRRWLEQDVPASS